MAERSVMLGFYDDSGQRFHEGGINLGLGSRRLPAAAKSDATLTSQPGKFKACEQNLHSLKYNT